MYIKQITIHGFKSYRQKTVIEQFDRRHNVVVGRNGSGKSNFFSAIEFVLSDEYNNMRTEHRKALINRVTASPAAFAYVEIVFDSTDSHIPVEKDEIRIRRTVTKIKDQYMLDGKIVTRKDVVQFLETTGLSNSSPYYIVKQGKINQLATARPAQLLQVLFEISGIRVYNEQRKYSISTLKRTDVEMKSVVEARNSHAQLVETLGHDKRDLEQYEKLEKKRRILEFMVLERDQLEIADQLNSLGHARDTFELKQRGLATQMEEAQQHVADFRRQLKQNTAKIASAMERVSNLTNKNHRLVKVKINVEMKVEDLMKDLMTENLRQAQLQTQRRNLNKTIEQREATLADVTTQSAKLQEQLDGLDGELRKKKQKREERLDKQRRSVQFDSRIKRDRWLKQELATLEKQIQQKTARLQELEIEYLEQKEKLRKGEQFIDSYDKMCQKLSEQKASYTLRINIEKANRNELFAHQEDLWEKESTLQQVLAQQREDLLKLEQTIKKQIGFPVFIGCESMRKVLGAFRSLGADKHYIIDGYLGLVVDSFKCDEHIYQAVETSTGSKLFYHIVKSDAIVKEILAAYDKQRLPGTIQFLPLNLMRKQTFTYTGDNSRAIPVISLLQYDEEVKPALQTVFGKTLLCKNLDMIPQDAVQHGFPCVTYDGDQVQGGSIKGGYHAPKTSILELHRRCTQTRDATTQLEAELEAIRAEIKQVESSIFSCETTISQLDVKIQKLSIKIETGRTEKRSLPQQRRQLDDKCNEKEQYIRTYKNELESMESRMEALSNELSLELTDQLTEEDQRAIKQLDGEIKQLSEQQEKVFNAALEAKQAKNKLQNMLDSNLLPKRDELTSAIERSNHEDQSNEMAGYRKQIEGIIEKNTAILQQKKNLEQTITTINQQNNAMQKELATWLETQKRVEEEMVANSPALSPTDGLRQSLEKRLAECANKIKELGALPAMNQVYYTLPKPKLMREMEQTKTKLKNYVNVNKRALDAYAKESQKLNEIDRRINELTEAKKQIISTFQVLSLRREECIRSTFENVNRNFTNIFRRFVPSGEGHLILHTADNDGEAGPDGNKDTSDVYVGLGLKISFVGGDTIMSEMNQLSGGQKTMVAIALIFAIQQHKPAPFYLFDEIDQALDSSYRTTLADVIHELSNTSQFIMTTFRKELLHHANRFYGVRCRNKVSHIDQVTEKEALNFVKDDHVQG